MKYLTVIALYVVFSVLVCLAGPLGVLSLLTGRTSYISDVAKAMDRLTAAMFGWSGNSTVSKECDTSNCRFCVVLCKVLNKLFGERHCR